VGFLFESISNQALKTISLAEHDQNRYSMRIKKLQDIIKLPMQYLLRMISEIIAIGVPQIKRKSLNICSPNVLFVRRNKLGDSVVAAIAIKQLIDSTPNIKISIICSEVGFEIFKKFIPGADLFLLHNQNSVLSIYLSSKLKKFLKSQNFTHAINLSDEYSSKSALIIAMSKAKISMLVRSKKVNLIERFITDLIDPKELNSKHQVEKFLYLFKKSNLFTMEQKKLDRIDINLNNKQIKICKILFLPECNRAFSTLSDINWNSLFNKMYSTGAEIKICVSSNKKIEFSNEIIYKLKITHNIQELMNEIESVDLILCCEGGSAHLVSLFNKNFIVLTGVSIENGWEPYGSNYDLIDLRDERVMNNPVEYIYESIIKKINI
jgi:ADP-heptose:LPS heptosyltransferase